MRTSPLLGRAAYPRRRCERPFRGSARRLCESVAVVATAGKVLELHKVVEEQAYPGWVFVIRGDF